MGGSSEEDGVRAEMLSAALAPDGLVDLRRWRAFVPTEWAGRASVGLDGVLRITHPDATLHDLPAPVREHLALLAPALASQQLGGEGALDALEAGHRLGALLEGSRVPAVRELSARTADKALAIKGVTSPEELSITASRRWRARSKSVTATELQALTGLGRDTAREVVAIANAPQGAGLAVEQGLAAGIARWDLVVAWWRRCRRLPHEASTAIARALFGTDVPVEDVASERLTPTGTLSDRPWAKKKFHDALEELARQHESADPAAQEKRRQAAHARRDAYAIVDDDGTAQLVITGDIASVTADLERLQTIAVRAKAEGDPRTLPQLRSDTARALLLHGTLPLPDLGTDPNFITPDDIERLVDVLAATPTHELQVIVPWDALTGHAALVNPYPGADTAEPDRVSPAPAPSLGSSTAAGESANVLEGVGRVLGRFSQFLSASEVRRIAGRPGTTIYRLLTDPADGRCIERSVARYAPDAAMRAQVRAADVFSRAPGSMVLATRADLDHVQEYLLGGPTSETNLQTLDRPWHAWKTEKFWDAVMDATRNVTWESFWGRLYPTRPHDYRQYLSRPHPAAPANVDPPPPPASDDGLTPGEQRHLASLLVYAALAHRRPGERLEARDDDPDSDAEILGLREAIWLRHTTSTGRRKTGPRPGTPTPEQLITRDPHAVLDHPDRTSLGATAAPEDPGVDDPRSQPPPPPPF